MHAHQRNIKIPKLCCFPVLPSPKIYALRAERYHHGFWPGVLNCCTWLRKKTVVHIYCLSSLYVCFIICQNFNWGCFRIYVNPSCLSSTSETKQKAIGVSDPAQSLLESPGRQISHYTHVVKSTQLRISEYWISIEHQVSLLRIWNWSFKTGCQRVIENRSWFLSPDKDIF